MGDFVVYRQNKVNEATHNAMLETLSAQGSKNPKFLHDDSYKIITFQKNISPIENISKNDTGDFCISSGSFFYRGHTGKQALDILLQDFSPNHYSPYSFLGIFTLIIRKEGRLFIVSDPMGASRIFHNEDKSIWSSSFLALAENTPTKSADTQGIYEYCFQETNYGSTTPIKEIKTANSHCYFELHEKSVTSYDKNIPVQFETSTSSYDDLIEEHRTLLQTQIDNVAASHGDKISTALSGGYDSRLMLSLLKNTGITPSVYVYGSDNSPDVQVAKAIAAGEGFNISHINKANYPIPSVDDYPAIVKDNFYALDGYPNEGIFDFGANMATRRERTANGTLIFNGGGGEIYRNFFYLPDREYSVNDLLDVFYSRYTNKIYTNAFSEKDYRRNLSEKIKAALKLSGDKMSRTELEFAYPAFRLRYWTSKDNSNSTRLGSYLTPFICYETIMAALKLPLKYKTHGKFQGDLINKVNPSFASYPSDYGYAFNEDVPFKAKIKNNMTIYRPTLLRRYSYAIQHKMATLNIPDTLSASYMEPLLPKGTPVMDQYFKIDNIKDANLLGRVMTLEYLFEHLGL